MNKNKVKEIYSSLLRRGKQMKNLTSYIILLCLIVFFTIFIHRRFFTLGNWSNIFQQCVILLIVALGETFVLVIGSIDLSVGSVLCFSSIIGASVTVRYGMLLGILAAILTGMLCGSINGLIFTKVRIPSFIITLGMMMMARGLAVIYCGGMVIPLYGRLNAIVGFPVIVYIAFAALFVCYILYEYSIFGHWCRAIGGGESVAGLTGVPLKKVKLMVFLLCGALTGLAGIVLAARCGAGTPTSGIGLELEAISAVVLGGTLLTGGIGSIQGTLVGVLIMTILRNGLIIMQVSSDAQTIIRGIVFILAVSISLERGKIGIIK